ncbi:MAG: AI-2E family transporter [Spirochaetales bacterium]|nr:AI-2E family transporter [Spirochaetales bacterium]
MEEGNARNLKHIRTALIVIAAILVLCVLKVAREVTLEIVLSVFLFLLLSPLTRKMDGARFPRWLSTLLSVIIFFIVIAAAVMFFFNAVNQLLRTLPKYSGRLAEIEHIATVWLGSIVDLPENFSLSSDLNIDWIGVAVTALRQVSSMAVTIVSRGALVILFVVFLLIEREAVVPKLTLLVRSKDPETVAQIFARVNRQISKYLALKTLISAVTGVAFYVICRVPGLEFAVLIGVLAFVMNFIPTIGSIVVTLLTILMAVLQFFPLWNPILFITVSAIVAQMVLGNILDPRVQGNQLNLSPVIILFSLTVWGYIWGVLGMFLAVPMMSMSQICFANFEQTKPLAKFLAGSVRRREHRHKKDNPQQDFIDSIVLPESKSDRQT